MEDLIERLHRWLRENRLKYYSKLLPGLTDEEILALEEALCISLPPEVKLFYKWRNGQVRGGAELIETVRRMHSHRDRILHGDILLF